jgi:hypothetical protein
MGRSETWDFTRGAYTWVGIEELMSLPGIGAKRADKILELREAKGDLELDDLNQVPYLRITPQLIECLDFTSFENKEGVGSLYDRHRERVRSESFYESCFHLTINIFNLSGEFDCCHQSPSCLL